MPDRDLAKRLKKLRAALGYSRQTGFATALDLELSRWNNFERGAAPLSIDVARRIVQRFHGLTLDYLYFGNPDGLSVAMARRLGELPPGNNTPPPPPSQPRREEGQ